MTEPEGARVPVLFDVAFNYTTDTINKILIRLVYETSMYHDSNFSGSDLLFFKVCRE
jgi:hypothetical protein